MARDQDSMTKVVQAWAHLFPTNFIETGANMETDFTTRSFTVRDRQFLSSRCMY